MPKLINQTPMDLKLYMILVKFSTWIFSASKSDRNSIVFYEEIEYHLKYMPSTQKHQQDQKVKKVIKLWDES